ncbi:MAG: hypothetical protein Q8R15_00605 [Candidatus Micrarchaeota archaeon]|nr:hypothetical protein [Candidatus Micrarchaeota archaeon]
MNLPNPYSSKNYKYLAIVPTVLFILALGLIFFKGIPQGVDLRGGILLNVQTSGSVNVDALQKSIESVAPVANIRTFQGPNGIGVEIEIENNALLASVEDKVKALQSKDSQLRELEVNASLTENVDEIKTLNQKQSALNAEILTQSTQVLEQLNSSYVGTDGHVSVRKVVEVYGNSQDAYREGIITAVKSAVNVTGHSFREVGPSLSKFFLEKAQGILLYSFILAALVVLILFRSIVPSIAVISGAVVDIVVTLGAMSLFNIPLSLASIAGLLMLIGFSLDTDVMLTMRVLKRKEGTANERAYGAFKTGALMNLTSIGAFGVLTLTGLYLQIPVYYQLGLVAVIGSIVDFAATWGANAVFVLKYAESQEAKKI